ncbi:membrane protein [Mycobacterium phage Zenteno07]|nr:membrane protein [Mycobacterium phage Zenteno07]
MTDRQPGPFECVSQAHIWTSIVLSCLAIGLAIAALACAVAT